MRHAMGWLLLACLAGSSSTEQQEHRILFDKDGEEDGERVDVEAGAAEDEEEKRDGPPEEHEERGELPDFDAEFRRGHTLWIWTSATSRPLDP